MTLAELVHGRRAAIVATAAAVSATVAVTAVLAASGDDESGTRTGDSLGSEPTGEPAVDQTQEPTQEPSASPTAEVQASSGSGGSEVSSAPESKRSPETRGDEVPPTEGPFFGWCGPMGDTSPGPAARQASSHPSETAEPSPSPSPTPTDTTVEPTEPAPPTASASSTADPGRTVTPSPSGSAFTGTVVCGRPMRRDGDLLVPDVRTGSGPAAGDLPRPDVTGLDPRDRAALARLWTQAARGELASVPAFHDLALVLSALGAPLDLVARATQAALDEVDHTHRAFAIAGAYAGEPVEGGALPGLLGRRIGQATTPRAALTRLAVEALADGCWHEGAMAAILRLAADTADDPALHASLDVIATDEAGHAVLSLDLLAWCLSVGDSRLRNRIAKELASLPREVPSMTDRDADPEVLARHGWPTSYDVERVVAAHRLAVVARVEGLLV